MPVLNGYCHMTSAPEHTPVSQPNGAVHRLQTIGGEALRPATTLTGWSLVFAWAGWFLALLLSLIVLVASMLVAAETELFATLSEVAGEVDIALYRVFSNGQIFPTRALFVISITQLVAFLAIGLLLSWRRSRDWLALLTSAMLISTGVGFGPGTFLLPVVRPDWALAVTLLQVVMFGLLVTFLFIFPSGRVAPQQARPVVVGWLLYTLSWLIFPEFSPHQASNPLALFFFIGVVMIGTGAQVYRYRNVSNATERQQSKWVMLGFVTTNICFFVLVSASVLGVTPRLEAIAPVATQLLSVILGMSAVLIPISIGVAISRYRLWDIDQLVNRALVYGALTAIILGLYIGVVGALGAIFRTDDSLLLSVVATGLIAVLFNPVRERLQRSVNRIMYGDRDDPFTVVSQLGQRMEDTAAFANPMPVLVETIAEALKLPYVGLTATANGQEQIVAEHGTRPGTVHPVPLVTQSQTIGTLLVAPRSSQEPFTASELRLLDTIAQQASALVYADQLNASLQHSREQLVLAQEEERRRLQRDLHDGLGPHLASLSMRLEVAQNLVRTDPEAATVLLAALKKESQEAVADIRRLVYALRPPVLDQLGLSEAMSEFLTSNRTPGGPKLHADIPSDLPELPAAVETAAYRIMTEAVANCLHHASATRCEVRLRMSDGGVRISVTDDGYGLPDPVAPGIGMTSIRQRASELGGWVTFQRRESGGTTVEIFLPVPATKQAEK